MLSQKSRYALKALLVLAARGDTDPMQISEIAETASVPRKFLEQILLELKKPGIVRSHRGRLGGYSLGRPAKDISFADVLRVTDGPLALSSCVSVMAESSNSNHAAKTRTKEPGSRVISPRMNRSASGASMNFSNKAPELPSAVDSKTMTVPGRFGTHFMMLFSTAPDAAAPARDQRATSKQ